MIGNVILLCSLYFAEGFLHLQKAVGEAIIEWKMKQLNKTLNTNFNLEMRVHEISLSDSVAQVVTYNKQFSQLSVCKLDILHNYLT